MLIALVRHGETDYNKQFIIQGRFDIPLNELGKKQAIETAQHFKEKTFDVIISSPLVRAKETAEIISKEIDYDDEIILDEAFIERNFGEADGKNVYDYIDQVHKDDVKGLEREKEIKFRVYNGLIQACRKHRNKNIMIVCHSHAIKALLSVIDPNKYDFKTKLDNCSISLLECTNNDIIVNKVNYKEAI